MVDFNLTADQHVTAHLTVAETDKWGNPVGSGAPDAGTVPVWGSDNVAVLTVSAAADSVSADVVAVGPVGSANLTVSFVVNGATITVTKNVVVAVGVPVGASGDVTFDTPVTKA